MKFVAAGARHGVDHRARTVPLRRTIVAGLNAEFLQRVGKRERLVLLVIGIGVAGAIQSEGHLARLRPVGRHPQRAGNGLARFAIDRCEHHAGD